jgi:hypothetical protein
MFARSSRWVAGLSVGILTLVLAGCGLFGDNDPLPPAPSSAPSSAPASPNASSVPAPTKVLPSPVEPTAGKPTPPASAPTWPTSLSEKSTLTGTSFPVLNSIDVGAHPAEGYDRVTFDFLGPVPGYTAQYVTRVTQDGSGAAVSLAGSAYLQIVFNPANAHFDDGTVPGGLVKERAPGYQRLRAYKLVGDYEAYVSVALGLSGKAGLRAGTIPGQTHSRLYIDIQR